MAAKNPNPSRTPQLRAHGLWVLLACLVIIFGILFHKSFLPGYVLHNNDNPVGNNAQTGLAFPQGFTGIWLGLNWLGLEGGTFPPSLTALALWLAGAYWYAKFWQVAALIILGLCAWLFLRSQKFSPWVCIIGGLAFSLHGDPFSNSMWGQVSRPLALSAMLLALTALENGSGIRFWLRGLLAGAAVGWGIMEGFDVAALYSLVIGIYCVYQIWAGHEGSALKRLSIGLLRLALVAGFAAAIAASSLGTLIGVGIQGVSGMEETAAAKQARWDWATQWSLPKSEVLGAFIPGLFGYRMDTPEGGQYWGKSGRDAAWDRYFESDRTGPPPRAMIRFGGAGVYMGTVIPVLGLFALLQSFRRKDSAYSIRERKLIWFWAGLAFVCLLLSWGRFAPFYRFFYMIPYASTIRNPGKFFHIFDWATLILFSYGLHGLSQRWASNPATPARGLGAQWKAWRRSASTFDRRWLAGSILFFIAVIIGWIAYASAKETLMRYLVTVQIDPESAKSVAAFSIRQVGWFVLFMALTLLSVALILSGYFSGARAKFGAMLLGAVLVTDLARANEPWIVYWDYPLKYATNPVINKLAEKSYEQRVAMLPSWILEVFQVPPQIASAEQNLDQLYRVEWAQHIFLEKGIQSLEVIQLPRPPEDYVAYETAFSPRSSDTLYLTARHWQLTNTRYILGMYPFVDLLNRQFDPGRESFHAIQRFDIAPKPGIEHPTRFEEITVQPDTNGTYALIEFGAALPRAKLYANWQVVTNDEATLTRLADRDFDPQKTVLISGGPAAPNATTNSANVGTVEITSYAPTKVELKAKAQAPSVLLLNDRYTPAWNVRVDGKSAELLRCNYLMRGVTIPAGEHTVEFELRKKTKLLYISLAGEAFTLVLLGLVLLPRKPAGEEPNSKN